MNEDRKKILIVDDEKMNVMALAHFLRPQYDIIVATDGAGALETAERQTPDIILLDIIMPDMSGFEVLLHLKDSPATINIPVIFITGLSNAEDEEKGLTLGAMDYITKPFNKSVVKARINTHLKLTDYIHTIEKLCKMDALTGLSNRRGFDDRISLEWGRAFREKAPLGLIIMDLDRFKVYNDTYGHPQGDVLLKSIAQVISGTMKRSTDFVSRWGGEEFIVLLPDTDEQGTKKIAEEIRQNVKNAMIPCADGTNTSTTLSLGAVSKIPDEHEPLSGFLEKADKLLYNAKKNGRDQVCM
jgi:diguanylate cyclase (GGDEF)-like protein